VEIARLTGCKNFVGMTDKFIFNAFVDLKQMQRFENGFRRALTSSCCMSLYFSLSKSSC